MSRPPGRPPMPKSDLIPTPGQKGLARASSAATAQAKETFLRALGACGCIKQAATAAGRSGRTVRQWRDLDPKFAEGWDEALETACDALEKEARRRAIQGVDEPIVSAGKVMRADDGTPLMVRRYSDRLLEVLLRAHRPEKFGAKPVAALGLESAGPVRVKFIIGDPGERPDWAPPAVDE